MDLLGRMGTPQNSLSTLVSVSEEAGNPGCGSPRKDESGNTFYGGLAPTPRLICGVVKIGTERLRYRRSKGHTAIGQGCRHGLALKW